MKEQKFVDIAGYETEKAEARKIVEFLKNYKEYIEEGITLPKGLILFGNPGVGKTLLAVAIANESKSRLIRFVFDEEHEEENMKKAFEEAKKNQPSILFIDELDTILATRWGEVPESKKKMLQIILTEMDGLSASHGVLVIATANIKTDIPDSLMRSGRLEKQMTINPPTYDERVQIIDLYMKKHESLNHISRETIAKKTENFTGAAINQLVNEVLLECKTKNQKPTLGDFENFIPVIIAKGVKRGNEKENIKYIVAHEIGHSIILYKLRNQIPSISISRYDDFQGFIRVESKKTSFVKKSDLEDEITILLGGIAGEMEITNDITNGSNDDLERAYSMIIKAFDSGMYGMKYFFTHFKKEFMYRQILSDKKIIMIENKIVKILNNTLSKARKIIRENMDIYNKLANELSEHESLSSERVAELLES